MQCILLPGSFLVQLIHVSQVGIRLGRISNDDAEDLHDSFPKITMRGDSVEDLIQNQKQRLFVRLDACSLKDSLIGAGPVKSISDLCSRLATSARGMRGIQDLRDASIPICLYLFPWDDTIQTELEYRVYCPPKTGKIAAISQYRWHAPWYHAQAQQQQEHERIAKRLLKGCEEIHRKIVAHSSMTDMLRSNGFVFDVVEDPATQDVRLMELNDFGALSGCGSCLYQRIHDAKLLYGTCKEVELRVTF